MIDNRTVTALIDPDYFEIVKSRFGGHFFFRQADGECFAKMLESQLRHLPKHVVLPVEFTTPAVKPRKKLSSE